MSSNVIQENMRYLTLSTILAFTGCLSPLPPISNGTDDYGRHPLPFRPNERFVLESIIEEPGYSILKPVTIIYYLDGRRRKFVLTGVNTTDGYVTDLGRIISSESSETESAIMEERVIQLDSGEQITIVGNTVTKGQVRLTNKKKGNKSEM